MANEASLFSPHLLLAGYVLDLIAGDPHEFPHPVRAFGWSIEHGERFLRQYTDQSPHKELIAGTALTAVIVGSTYTATALLLRGAQQYDKRLTSVLAVLLAWTTLATRNLLDEASAVAQELENHDLAAARSRLSRIVGRDTGDIDECEIARAAIETLAESLCDGVIAPLCAAAVGGVPAAMAFKAISTLDSMIGHIEPPYTFFGRFAARLDDAANFIPARITALLIIAVSSYPSRATRMLLRDGSAHRSPNGGHCEAAMAGALGVRLGGPNRYDGIVREAPLIGGELRTPCTADIRSALRVTLLASVAGALLATFARSTRA